MLNEEQLLNFFDKNTITTVKNKINNKAKPLGALGTLEHIALQLGVIQNVGTNNPILVKPAVALFAGDHGIAAKNSVSIVSSSFTTAMINNFINQGAGINAICQSNDIPLYLINAGVIDNNFIDNSKVIDMSVGKGTKDFSEEDAMTEDELNHCLENGASICRLLKKNGANILICGEMGIGNTSSASAILSKLYNIDPEITVGLGTGINNQQLITKKALIAKALNRHSEELTAHNILRAYGGFEIAQMCGAMLEAYNQNMTILVDGFVVSAATIIACAINPMVKGHMIFAHTSGEGAHALMLNKLGVTSILNFGMRLGEGTGAAVVVPLLKSAAAFFNNMADFNEV